MNKMGITQQMKDMFEAMDPKNIDNLDDWIVTYKDDVDVLDRNKRHKPEIPRATFRDDPLALSCASYRIYKNEPARRFVNIDTVNATPEDRVHAQAIRDYYNGRYTMKALRGNTLTEWQQKAAQFLSGMYHLNTDELGMLYKLPYFYEEDLTMDEIIAETTTCVVTTANRFVEEEQLTLTPLRRVMVTRKGSADVVHYYYLDQHQHAVVVSCPSTNQLSAMMDGLFLQPKICVKGYSFLRDIGVNAHHHIKKLGRWELVF
ncbi:hypothetical protein UFOVP328_11 [uncultured Caudovirales phage]|uniref:Uncharacterized protein n=1 Tax=uncultured Caudovirales phage TaxID=2100421 RepID=A0A6J5LSW8_9CAUD|nr:hypothetical protein UFOVP328_11 [uncultured Caudovirales phage]